MYKSSNGRFLEVETLNRASIICNIHIPSFFSTIIHSFVNSFIDFICFLVIFFIGTASEQTASITCKLTQSLITYLLERKMWKKWTLKLLFCLSRFIAQSFTTYVERILLTKLFLSFIWNWSLLGMCPECDWFATSTGGNPIIFQETYFFPNIWRT